MPNLAIPAGTVHALPEDLRTILTSHPEMLAVWHDITPLARNEWICWIESAKQEKTRHSRLSKAIDMLTHGKRRPCCWPGCPHR